MMSNIRCYLCIATYSYEENWPWYAKEMIYNYVVRVMQLFVHIAIAAH